MLTLVCMPSRPHAAVAHVKCGLHLVAEAPACHLLLYHASCLKLSDGGVFTVSATALGR